MTANPEKRSEPSETGPEAVPASSQAPAGGRPTKLTPEVQESVVDDLEQGNFFVTALAKAGIGESTGYDWLKRGKEEGEGPYYEFLLAVRRANAVAQARLVRLLHSHALDSFAAVKFALERRHRQEWGSDAKAQGLVPESGPDGADEPELDLSRLSDEELALYERLHRKACGNDQAD